MGAAASSSLLPNSSHLREYQELHRIRLHHLKKYLFQLVIHFQIIFQSNHFLFLDFEHNIFQFD